MKNESFYSHEVDEIEIIETHISFVFLTGKFVYKIKKAVKFGEILDFRKLSDRQQFCKNEVKLNRRLAPELYLGVVSITPDGIVNKTKGQYKKFEHAVKMKQLPNDNILENILENKRTISDFDLDRIANKIVNFHNKVDNKPKMGKFSYVKNKFEENFRTLHDLGHNYKECRRTVRRFLSENKSLFNKRVKNNRIKDGHGDLQAKNIFVFPNKIIIFDCIEFNENLRAVDVAEEISFLAIDLDFFGLEKKSNYFINQYIELSKDYQIYDIINFYKSYRAIVRAKVNYFNAKDLDKEQAKDINKVAEKYMDLAFGYLEMIS